MTFPLVRRALLAALALSLTVPAVAQAGKRLITTQDIFAFHWVGDTQLSPDGTKVVFVEATVNAEKSGYDTGLWIVPTDASAPPTRLTQGPHDSQPTFSPDGTRLAFVRTK